MKIPLKASAENARGKNLLILGGGEQEIKVRTIGMQGETHEQLRVLLEVLDRRAFKSPEGRFRANHKENLLQPLPSKNARQAFMDFDIDPDERLVEDAEYYVLQQTGYAYGRPNGEPRDTVLKFLGTEQAGSRDAKIAMNGFGFAQGDVELYVTAHPSIPVNRARRMIEIMQGNDPQYDRSRQDYVHWLEVNGIAVPEALPLSWKQETDE